MKSFPVTHPLSHVFVLFFMSFGIIAVPTIHAQDRVFVTTERHVMEVDPISGDRAIISSATIGSGPIFAPAGGAMDVSGPNSLVLGQLGPTSSGLIIGILEIDVDTGNRRIVSSNDGVGGGPDFGFHSSIAVAEDGRIYVGEFNRILAVDPSNGIRSVVMDHETGSGPNLGLIRGIAFEGTASMLVSCFIGIYRINLSNGNRTLIADDAMIMFPTPRLEGDIAGSLEFESSGELIILMTDLRSTVLTRLNLSTGSRERFGNFSGRPNMADMDLLSDGKILITEFSGITFFGASAIHSVDPVTGLGSILSGPSLGSGPLFRGGAGPTAYNGPFAMAVMKNQGASAVDYWTHY